MWEAIRQNRRRSTVLIVSMALILLALGAGIGGTFGGPEGLGIGLAGALVLWGVTTAVAVSSGGKLLLGAAGAKPIAKQDAPMLWNTVEEMTLASGLAKMPEVHVIESDGPNAFAVARSHEQSAVAVTTGLMRRMNRDELQGVVAHEVSHIHNLDSRFMTHAAVMVGGIALMSDIFLRGMFWTGGGRRRSSDSGGGQAQAVIMIVTLVIAILGPLAAHALYFACSRRREYLADACAARFTRYPEGLASALEKLAVSTRGAGRKAKKREKDKAQSALLPLYIVNPLQASKASSLTATHPPLDDRIKILRSMGGGAGFADYEAAWKKLHAGEKSILGQASLGEDASLEAREASVLGDELAGDVDASREALDLLDRMAEYLVLPCACGVRVKVPPQLERDSVPCVRCGRELAVPKADAEGPGPAAAEEELSFRREHEGEWESFRCSCGHAVQLSPRFEGTRVRCSRCERQIRVER